MQVCDMRTYISDNCKMFYTLFKLSNKKFVIKHQGPLIIRRCKKRQYMCYFKM